MDIQSNNELIAEFMGLKTPLSINQYSANICENNGYYHKDWNWLMPVVEKIEKEHNYFSNLECAGIGIYEFSLTQYQSEDADQLELPDGIFGRSDERCKELKDARLEVVYKIVVEFIKWYNERNEEI